MRRGPSSCAHSDSTSRIAESARSELRRLDYSGGGDLALDASTQVGWHPAGDRALPAGVSANLHLGAGWLHPPRHRWRPARAAQPCRRAINQPSNRAHSLILQLHVAVLHQLHRRQAPPALDDGASVRPATRAERPNSNCSLPATRGSSSTTVAVTGKSCGGKLANSRRQSAAYSARVCR